MTLPVGTSRAGDQLVCSGAQDRPHRPVEPVQRPILGQPRRDQRVQLLAASVGALDQIVEEIDLGLGIFDILDRRADAMVVEFVEQVGIGVCSISR